MKTIFFILLALPLILKVHAQELFPESNNGTVEYKNIIEVQANKEELYKRLKLWIAESFKNPSGVIKMDDPNNGLLKLIFTSPFIDGRILYTSLQIEIKDNKLRYTFNEIYTPVEPAFQNNMTAEGINRRIKEKTDKGKKPMKFLIDYVTSADKIIKNMIQSLTDAVTNKNDF